VVRNAIVTYRRRPDGRIRARGASAEANEIEPPADATEPDTFWETAFERAMLAVLLDVVRREVNPREYLAFELLALEELSGAEAARITGLTRNAAYKARRRVMRRLKALAGTYADDGRLSRDVREALRLRPPVVTERSLTARIQQTMRSRWEPAGQ
jgi:DNA-directed RNA polymerase specialized sigma24 family protein